MPGQLPRTAGIGTYLLVTAGQFAALIGGGLVAFALGIHVYRTTGSATTLSVVFVLSVLPFIIGSPAAGALVDRWGPKRSLLVSTIGGLLVALTMVAPLLAGELPLWHIYVVVALLSVLGSVEVPAFTALVPRLVPKEKIGRANGLRMFAIAVGEVLTPLMSGTLLAVIELVGVVIVDVVVLTVALVTLVLARVPGPEYTGDVEPAGPATASDGARSSTLRSEIAEGWHYLRRRPGLVSLLLFLAGINFSAGFIDILLTPLVLTFTSSGQLGLILTIGGVGMVSASIAVTVWGTPKRRVRAMLLLSLVLAVATVFGASRPVVAVVAVAAFVFLAALAVLNTTHVSIWQEKVDPRLHGRVVALVNMGAAVPQLLAYAASGVLVDRVFNPLVGRDDVKVPALVPLLGDGPGRGTALLLMCAGLLIAVNAVVAAANPRLRRLEDELPDVVAAGGTEPAVTLGERS